MEAKVIIATVAKTTRENKKIWSVGIEGEEQPAAFCKSAYKAMRFCFLLKKRTGLNISDNCLSRLSHEIAKEKATKAEAGKERIAEAVESFIEEHSVDNVLAQAEQPKPKKQRKPRAKKSELKVVALS
jgi:hypothetical protein